MKKMLGAIAVLSIAACSINSPTNSNLASEAVASAEVDSRTESERLNEWFDKKYERLLRFSPMTLTRLGRKEGYGQIDDMSKKGIARRLIWLNSSVRELRKNFDYNKLDDNAKVSYDLWKQQYQQARLEKTFQNHQYIFTQMQGPQTALPNFLINYHTVDSVEDMNAYIERIGGISGAIFQLISRASDAARAGIRPPYFAYEEAIKQSKNLISGKPFDDSNTDSALLSDAKTKLNVLVDRGIIERKDANDFEQKVEQALLTLFRPAYDSLILWLETDFTKVSKVAKGAGSLPKGSLYYSSMLKLRTTTQMSATQIHELGLSEVERLRSEMEGIIEQLNFDGSLQDFFAYIKRDVTDSRFYYPNTDNGRQAYLNDSTSFLDIIAAKLPEYFGILPKAKLEVKRVEAFREQPGAAQHYYPGTPDGSRSGTYYAHLSDMTAMPKNEMEAIAYHEGNPGHHMQISIAQELEGIPKFRTQAFFTSYVEGWALYSEVLAKDMGAYQDPYSEFGRLVTEMWRAIRLVVDTGIHSKGWTEEDAIAYFKNNSPMSDGAIVSEVRRYFVWPGQATAYKIGMLKILELRDKAKTELGEKFNIRNFHDVVLGGGSVPLSVLEEQVDNWIFATTTEI